MEGGGQSGCWGFGSLKPSWFPKSCGYRTSTLGSLFLEFINVMRVWGRKLSLQFGSRVKEITACSA